MGAGIHTTPRHLTKKFSGSIGNTTLHSLPGRGDRARHRVGLVGWALLSGSGMPEEQPSGAS